MADNLFNAHNLWFFLSLPAWCSMSLSNIQITLALCLLLHCCTLEYLMLHEIFCVLGRLIIFHPIISFFYLLYHNVTSWTSSKIIIFIPGPFVYYLLSLKWNFVFTLRNSDPAKSWLTNRTVSYGLADLFSWHYIRNSINFSDFFHFRNSSSRSHCLTLTCKRSSINVYRYSFLLMS